MPLHEIVREEIIVHMFVVLVWTNDIGEFIVLGVGIPLGTATPEYSGVEDHLRTITDHECVVTGRPPVLPDCIGNIRGDVDLNVTRPDAYLLLTIGRPGGC